MKTKQALSVTLMMMGLFTYNITLADGSCPDGLSAYEITQFPTTIDTAKTQNLYTGPYKVNGTKLIFYCLPQGTIDRQYPIRSIPSDTTKEHKEHNDVGTVQFGEILQTLVSSTSPTSNATTSDSEKCTPSQIPVIVDQDSNISLKWPNGENRGTINTTNSPEGNVFYFSFMVGSQEYPQEYSQEYQYRSLNLQSIPCALPFYSIDYLNSRILFSLN